MHTPSLNIEMVCFYSKEMNSVHSPSPISSLSLFYIYFSGSPQRCFPGTTDKSLKFAPRFVALRFLSGFKKKRSTSCVATRPFVSPVFISSRGWHRRARSRGMQRNAHTKF
ncbi:hypothetical protein CDAR_85551 [Caerostris darwini]|uniref:Uncharacterized protein n=1 Tax=Caerostris darwini TaxID=1538125 RepID=A0AAV4R0T8_9ARAC|nr:hypothetical protein CDAR_85551 [Caerostris darwini]